MPSHHGPAAAPEGEYPNETLRFLHERASCRSFLDKRIPPETLRYVLKAGVHAPTGGNLQPYSFIKIEDEDRRRKIAELCHQRFIGDAPVLLLACIDWHRNERWADLEVAPFTATSSFRHFWISFQDAVIAIQNVSTACDAVGLGSVYIGSILEIFRELRDMLSLPGGVFPVVLLCVGYPGESVLPRRKLDVDVVVHDELYRDIPDDELLRAFNAKYAGPGSRRVEITEERIETIRRVCVEVHGEDFARRCVEKVRENGFISSIQRYFGLHYRADGMPRDNLEYLEMMEEFGFGWFKEFVPEER